MIFFHKRLLNNVSEKAEGLKDTWHSQIFAPKATKFTQAISPFDQNEWSSQKQM